jgi:alpha-glucosidase
VSDTLNHGSAEAQPNPFEGSDLQDELDFYEGSESGAAYLSGADWWRSAIFYQIYPRSFADGNGDGIGDLIGARRRLDYLQLLGIDAVWLSPFYRSPMADGGYDVADPTDVDPMFGTLADFDAFVAEAHARSIKVTVDIVPNHFSDQHAWFQAALAAGPGSPERDRFIFREGRGPDGSEPPNNWPAMFGGSAWERVPDGQWYLHIFAPEQPDLNWANPEVSREFERILRFWMDRGADGFRVDVAHSMAKPAGLPDMDLTGYKPHTQLEEDLRFDQDGVHEHLRMFRSVLDSYPHRMAVGEAWVPDDERLARYVRPDELHLTFNFRLVEAPWSAADFAQAIDGSLAAMAEVGAPCTWVLSNHDVVRHTTRYGGGALGQARGRAAALVTLSLPGAAYIYNGEELGLENVDLPDDVLQDPTWERSGHTDRGRDGERVPMPWEGTEPPFGFGQPGTQPWLPMPAAWRDFTVEAELEDEDSTLSLYRKALRLRRSLAELHGSAFQWQQAPEGCLAYRRGPSLVVALNASDVPVPLPPGEVLLASGPLEQDKLPANTTVWLRG